MHCFVSIELGMVAFSVISTPGGASLSVGTHRGRERVGVKGERVPGTAGRAPHLVVSPGQQVPDGISLHVSRWQGSEFGNP